MSGTSSDFPGWYVNFQAAILKQLPRPGQIDQDVADGWEGNQKSLKEKLAAALLPPASRVVVPAEPTVKFALLADLGSIVMPESYDHGKCLAAFAKQNRKKFYYYNDDITDAHFSAPSRVLKPGDKLYVKAYNQIVGGTTTSEERMAFLEEQKEMVYTGAQGASVVWDQKRDQLPKGFWYASFDEKKRLWEDAGGARGVPLVSAGSDGVFRFFLGDFGEPWDGSRAFFSFRVFG